MVFSLPSRITVKARVHKPEDPLDEIVPPLTYTCARCRSVERLDLLLRADPIRRLRIEPWSEFRHSTEDEVASYDALEVNDSAVKVLVKSPPKTPYYLLSLYQRTGENYSRLGQRTNAIEYFRTSLTASPQPRPDLHGRRQVQARALRGDPLAGHLAPRPRPGHDDDD